MSQPQRQSTRDVLLWILTSTTDKKDELQQKKETDLKALNVSCFDVTMLHTSLCFSLIWQMASVPNCFF